MKWQLLFCLLLLQTSVRAQAPAHNQRLSDAQLAQAATQCIPQAPLNVVRAVVRTESAFHPLALSINYPESAAARHGLPQGKIFLKRQPRTKNEALYWTHWLLSHNYTVSIGLMQVNIQDARKDQLDAGKLLDPCTNLQEGWRIFDRKYQAAARSVGPGQNALRRALSLYNSGSPTRGFENGYVSGVVTGELLHHPRP